jgi:hypothetical protein
MPVEESSALLESTQAVVEGEKNVMKAVKMMLQHNYMLADKMDVFQTKQNIDYTECRNNIRAQVKFTFSVRVWVIF